MKIEKFGYFMAALMSLIMVLCMAAAVRAEESETIAVIYSEYDLPEGTVEIGIAPPGVASAEQTEPDHSYIKEIPLSAEVQEYLYNTWTAAGFDYALALAFIDVETGGTFNTAAINHVSHDYGLFQLNRRTWLKSFKKIYGISSMEEMLDPVLNIQGGLYVYSDCVRMYGQTERAIVAYNQGPTKTSSTKYSRKVLRAAEKWRKVLEAAG